MFLQGTFYRWLQRWPKQCESLVDAPSVLAVPWAISHIENFGTWRDAEGRLIWGINDFDEAFRLPYTQDPRAPLDERAARDRSRALHPLAGGLRAARSSTAIPRRSKRKASPLVLAERRRWLRHIALNQLRDPTLFWQKLTALPNAAGTVLEGDAAPGAARTRPSFRDVRRIAGVGSLLDARASSRWRTHAARFDARGRRNRGCHPPRGGCAARSDAARTTRRSSAAPFARPIHSSASAITGSSGAALSICRGIDLETMPDDREELKLLRAMGWETANMHLGSARDPILRDLRRRPARWLEKAAARMADAVFRDWRAFPPLTAAGISSDCVDLAATVGLGVTAELAPSPGGMAQALRSSAGTPDRYPA